MYHDMFLVRHIRCPDIRSALVQPYYQTCFGPLALLPALRPPGIRPFDRLMSSHSTARCQIACVRLLDRLIPDRLMSSLLMPDFSMPDLSMTDRLMPDRSIPDFSCPPARQLDTRSLVFTRSTARCQTARVLPPLSPPQYRS